MLLQMKYPYFFPFLLGVAVSTSGEHLMVTLNFTVRMCLSAFVHKQSFLNFVSDHLHCKFMTCT